MQIRRVWFICDNCQGYLAMRRILDGYEPKVLYQTFPDARYN